MKSQTVSPYTEGEERPTKEADHFRLVGGSFKKQGSLYMRLVLSDHKMSRPPNRPARILKVYIEALTGFSHVFSSDGPDNTLLSQGCILETSPRMERVGRTYRTGGGGEEPQIA